MKNIKILFYALLMFSLSACSVFKSVGINQVDDDVYWSTKDEPKSGQSYKDVEYWNKSKGPNPGLNEGAYTPNFQNTDPQTPPNQEELRAQEAYQAWVQKRGFTAAAPDTNVQSNLLIAEKSDNRDERRLGSDRNYYYDDPYYNVLSTNWAWTSFYTPIIVRPGFYNWAPGWNVGLSWNNRSGFNWGMGYNMGFGGFNMGYGYNSWAYGNPYAYDPFYYGYSPYGYSPYSYYGYSPYMYNPYGYYGYNRYGYGYGNGYGYGHGCGGYNHGRGSNDVVTNRPLMQPRNSMGSSTPAVGSRPGANPNGLSTRPSSNGVVDNASTGGIQPAFARPANGGTPSVYVPSRPSAANGVNTSRPGGDLIIDNNGRPVYVSPNNTPNNRPGNGTSGETGYSPRPGGSLNTAPNGRQVYVPARPRETNTTPSNGGDNNYRPNNGGSYRSDAPASVPQYSQPNNNNNRPSNNNSRPSYSAPSYSAPSYSQPSQSRPSYSAPAPRPSSGGGSTGSGGGNPGGGIRPR